MLPRSHGLVPAQISISAGEFVNVQTFAAFVLKTCAFTRIRVEAQLQQLRQLGSGFSRGAVLLFNESGTNDVAPKAGAHASCKPGTKGHEE